jgi:hypothetical protein
MIHSPSTLILTYTYILHINLIIIIIIIIIIQFSSLFLRAESTAKRPITDTAESTLVAAGIYIIDKHKLQTSTGGRKKK